MCQINSTPLKQKYIYAYRAYEKDFDGKLRSYYQESFKPPTGKKTGKSTSEPFHAFKTKTASRVWKNREAKYRRVKFFLCRLSGDLKIGRWGDDHEIYTVTGDYCTIIRQVKI